MMRSDRLVDRGSSGNAGSQRRAALIASLCCTSFWPAVAVAQSVPSEAGAAEDAAAETVESDAGTEILVTAQRRSESAQRVPISLVALSETALESSNITSVLDLNRAAPGFYAYRAPQAANTRLAIRGIGSAGNAALEPSVGAFVDGIYIPRPGPLLAGLNDIASVEVLRGPQGTLFGRNASVGALVFRTNDPEQGFEGSAGLEVGNYGRLRATGVINTPLTGTTAVRLAVLADSFDGYGRNELTGNRRFGASNLLSFRGGLRSELSPNLTWLLRGDYQRQRGDGQSVVTVDASTVTPTAAANFSTRLNGLAPRLDDTFNRTVRQGTEGRLVDDQWGGSSDLALDLGGYTLRLLSGYRDWKNRQIERDITLTAADLYGRDANYRSVSHSQELQIVSPTDLLDDHLNFVAGLYYYRERYDIGSDINLAPGYCDIFIRNIRPAQLATCLANTQTRATSSFFHQITSSYAAYGQATVKITDAWDVTGGLRYSHDDKEATFVSAVINPAATGLGVVSDKAALSFGSGKLTYRLNTTYRPAEDIMLFATLSTGYKSGGFDSGTGVALGNNRIFQPETTTNYEVGVKSQFLDRRLTANVTLFRMDIDQFQLRVYNGSTFSVRNAGSLRQQGVEFDFTARPTDELTLSFAGTRLDSEYTSFKNAPGLPGFGGIQDLTGTRPPYSPKWQGTAGVDYRTDISDKLVFNANAHLGFFSENDVGGGGDNNPQGIQEGYALVGARLAMSTPDDRWEFALLGDNLTQRNYCVYKYSNSFAGPLGLTDPVTGGAVQRCGVGEPRTVRAAVKVRF